MANEMANEMTAEVAVDDKQPITVDLIVTHIRPHFDELLGIYLLKYYGENFFPGVGEACIETWGEGKILDEYAGKTADDLLAEQKILFVGICDGMFDEHKEGSKAPTSAHLVAEYLSVVNKLELQKILKFCKRVDYDANSMSFDLHTIIKEMYDFYGDGDEGMQNVFGWAMSAIHAHIYGQVLFHSCKQDFSKSGKILSGPGVRIAMVKSDNSKMNKWIRYKFDSPEVIIQKHSTGHMIILTSPQIALDFRDVVRIVRMREFQKSDLAIPKWQILESPGNIPGSPWYFYEQGNQLLNGSLTSPEVMPSKLSLKEVAGAVALACTPLIDPCQNEKCRGQRCENYGLGLKSCRKKRYELYHK